MVTTFGTGSTAEGRVVALQSDGKIVVVGNEIISTATKLDFAIARYNSDGTLDTSFDTDGKVTTDFNGGDDRAFDVKIQKVGALEKIVVGGEADRTRSTVNDFALARYNPNGSLDTATDGVDAVGFGVNGKTTSVVAPGALNSTASSITGLAIDQTNRIVVVGTVGQLNVSTDIGIARYTTVAGTDGVLDTTFDPAPAFDTVAGTADRCFID